MIQQIADEMWVFLLAIVPASSGKRLILGREEGHVELPVVKEVCKARNFVACTSDRL
jgi:hypothetical protein